MNNSIVDIKNINFSYSKKRILLSAMSLTLGKGRIHGLFGKNGEGKSTLLKLIAGLDFSSSGEINVMGFIPKQRNPVMLQNIYFLPEDLPLSTISIADYEKAYSPFYPKFSKKEFNLYLKEFNIESKFDKLNQLSHGQKKKVFIAFGLATNTQLLIMDEPTNGLDIPSKGQFRRMVASRTNDNNCIIISTHQVRDLESLIDNIIVMNDHKIIFNQSIESISNKLVFKILDNTEDETNVLYSENNLRGVNAISINLNNEDSKLDIELLFNALINKNEQFNLIFKNQ